MVFLVVIFSYLIAEHQEGHYILMYLVTYYAITRNLLKFILLSSINKGDNC